jgi:hypothetical protein
MHALDRKSNHSQVECVCDLRITKRSETQRIFLQGAVTDHKMANFTAWQRNTMCLRMASVSRLNTLKYFNHVQLALLVAMVMSVYLLQTRHASLYVKPGLRKFNISNGWWNGGAPLRS